jgi:glycine reductase
MPSPRVVHYLNQFFGGVGGEDKADLPIEVRPGAVGPGRGLEQQWAGAAHIVATIIGGDNFVATRSAEAEPLIRAALLKYQPDVLVAGPAFNAGRYGLACGVACGVATELGIANVTAMAAENPALAIYAKRLLTVPTGDLASSMPRALPQLARLALKLARHEPLGSEHVYAKLHDFYYVTVGVGTAVNNARRFGEEIARELHAADVHGVILTAT